MSQVKLTLRPPPNVEFVQGFPGIPPGPDRPQAAVKGTIEVRVGQQGCKAKWVRIELKKIETLPGGGQTNTYFDFVGPSPVNLWQSGEEYSMLPTQDFPFYIRIPESIPPSIALEKGAGVKYELVATVCVKGKKGFLRRGKAIIQSTQTTIVLDKHELHSTWPVYAQPESRHHVQEGVHLTVDRGQTCYGPGDRVSIMATLKSDSLHTVILRGFEFTLKETTIFRAGPYATGKKGAPQVRVTIIGEQKVPVNVTLYGGTQHKAELTCIIPHNHTTTSLNAARHIDITYVINVKALMGTGAHLIMDLPVIISNWPKNVSIEAIKRIGTAPSLSLGAPSSAPMGNNRISHAVPNGAPANGFSPNSYQVAERISEHPDTDFGPSMNSPVVFNTAPSDIKSRPPLDEFGFGRPDIHAPATMAARTSSYTPDDPYANRPVESRPGTGRRPGTANSATKRFTVTNIGEDDPEPDLHGNGLHSGGSSGSPWVSAEEEKRRLWEKATADVARVQGAAARHTPPLSHTPPAVNPSPPITSQSQTPPRSGAWLSAEEEKLRLYNQAQETASRTQNAAGQSYSPPSTQTTFSPRLPQGGGASGSHTKSPSFSGQQGSSMPTVSAGAALYQHALSSMARGPAEQTLPSPPPSRGGGSPPVKAPAAYPSAEEEKAALRRYHEAKNAVDRTQGIQSPASNPVPYDSLYPNTHSRSGSYTAPAPSGMPPPFSSSANDSTTSNALSEKEKLRRAYDAQDAAASSQQVPAYSNPPAPYTPGGFIAPAPGQGAGLSEKEVLRRKYESQDAVAIGMGNPSAGGGPPQPPPRRPSASSQIQPSFAPPAPIAGGSKILSAIEEKALLKARYEAEEQQNRNDSNGSPPPPSFGSLPVRNNGNGFSTPHAPPPLAPRPPANYIEETQAEDARVRDSVAALTIPQDKTSGLDLRPFTPFMAGFNGQADPPGPPPPLPPKQLD